MTRRELASSVLDLGVRALKQLGHEPEGTRRDTCRRAGQLLRLVSQQINNGEMTLAEGEAWRDAGRLTIERWEASHVRAD